MTVTVDTTPRGLAHIAYDEAARVEDAYSAQVVKRRAAWRNAVPGKPADKARRALAEAVNQKTAATARKMDAWRAWHALGGPERAPE
jgi:hypothetical protein